MAGGIAPANGEQIMVKIQQQQAAEYWHHLVLMHIKGAQSKVMRALEAQVKETGVYLREDDQRTDAEIALGNAISDYVQAVLSQDARRAQAEHEAELSESMLNSPPTDN